MLNTIINQRQNYDQPQSILNTITQHKMNIDSSGTPQRDEHKILYHLYFQ